jgi:3-phytase
MADSRPPAGRVVRFATFNASLNRSNDGELIRDLSKPGDAQARNVAEIIQLIRPDILLINEFDHDDEGRGPALFQDNYLSVGQNGAEPISYPHRYSAEVNTGVPSGFDLDGDGRAAVAPGSRGYGNDAFGFGLFPGQYGMVLYSKYPIDRNAIRQFQRTVWRDMPGALLPTRADGSSWYSTEALKVFRLSSKSHWDVPVRVGDRVVHVLASHPTPPSFDGPEDRNGRRNHDEIRLWADYLTGGPKATYLGPEAARSPPSTFVLMGDMNADPVDGGSVPGTIAQLLDHPNVDASFIPTSRGASGASRAQEQANASQKGPAEQDTADFDDRSVGNLRVDYVLPSKDLKPVGGGVFWPEESDPLSRLVRMSPIVASSDHRLVYLDIAIDEGSGSK